jgi:hypothetical protein
MFHIQGAAFYTISALMDLNKLLSADNIKSISISGERCLEHGPNVKNFHLLLLI